MMVMRISREEAMAAFRQAFRHRARQHDRQGGVITSATALLFVGCARFL